jgi:hypothetical protein
MSERLPHKGSRARRVMEILFKLQHAVPEIDLMAAHGLDKLPPTMWRQGPYKRLATAKLIVKSESGWALTASAQKLMIADEKQLLGVTEEAEIPANLVPSRRAPEFRPMKISSWALQVSRPGALDYQTIPSLHDHNRRTYP